MSKRDDIDELYRSSKKLERVCRIAFWINIVCSTANIFTFCEFFVVFQIFTAIVFMAGSAVDDGVYWYNAEYERRKNNLQNAFRISLSEFETEGYYNNYIPPSILKYAVNTFESNYFSKNIASKMFLKSIVKSVLSIAMLISTGWLIQDGNVILIVTQAVFSAYIVEDTVNIALYCNRLRNVYDYAYSLLISFNNKEKIEIGVLLRYCVEYECIKAHYKVRLDSKIFKKNNAELSKKWDEIASQIKY